VPAIVMAAVAAADHQRGRRRRVRTDAAGRGGNDPHGINHHGPTAPRLLLLRCLWVRELTRALQTVCSTII
jgi:hypothetical protein